MKLFWGMIDLPIPHMHTFDPAKWVSKGTWEVKNTAKDAVIRETEFCQNTCTLCGDIVERKFLRGAYK